MIPLPERFAKSGWQFDLLHREGDLAIYRHSKAPGIQDFEVIRVQSHGDIEMFGKFVPAAETYPPTTSWGTCGFTYTTEAAARAKFAALQKEDLTKLQTLQTTCV